MKPLLSIAEVVAFTGLSEHSIRRSIRSGELPAAKLKGRYRIEEADLLAWVDDNRVRPPLPDPELSGLQVTPMLAPQTPPGSYRALARQRRQRNRAA